MSSSVKRMSEVPLLLWLGKNCWDNVRNLRERERCNAFTKKTKYPTNAFLCNSEPRTIRHNATFNFHTMLSIEAFRGVCRLAGTE